MYLFLCVRYHLISENTRFHYPDGLSIDGTECERPEIRF